MISKYCWVRCSAAFASVSEREERRAVEGLLLDAVDMGGRRDAGHLQMVGPTSITWVNWSATPCSSDPRRPAHGHRVAAAAQVRGHLLAPLERAVARPRPRRSVVRGGELGAPHVEPAVLLHQSQLLVGGKGMPFCMVSSLNVPVSEPSMEAPLSPQM